MSNIFCCNEFCSLQVELKKSGFDFTILISALIVIIGWFISHYFAQKRDVKNKKREIIVGYLINSYNILTNDVSHRKLGTQEEKRKLEDVISILQLFGSFEQIEMTTQIARKFIQNEDANLDNLINDLRNSLRKELGLSSIEGNVHWVRFDS